MPKISVILHTLISRFFLLLILLVSLPIVLLIIILPARYRYQSRILFWTIRVFYWCVVKASFVPISFEGKEHIPNESAVFVANHQSALDIPLLGVFTRERPHIWLARKELMKWKLLRWILPRIAIVIDTLSREKAMGSMRRLLRLVKGKNIDVMIFPEGARFSDDKVHPFFGGFVTLAKMLNYKVVPVYISGANKVYPPDTFWITYHPVKVIAGKPFTLNEGESDEAFKERVYQWFVEQSER